MSVETPETVSSGPSASSRPTAKKHTFLKIALLVLVAIVAVPVVMAALHPAEYHIARTATMSAPAATVFAQINNFHNWEAWSPWVKVDPAAKTTYEGPSAGIGAIFRWAGNAEVGEGSMTITESRPNDLVRIRLDFLKPFEGTANVEFTMQPHGEQTVVTWSMSGNNNFLGRLICLFMNMDEMIGGKYEEGLASMKAIVERPENSDAPADATAVKTEG